jgi:transcriptional/translational regulatory protein YebC/TACO1
MPDTTIRTNSEVVLIGAGIMSATLGLILKELQPDIKIEIYAPFGSFGTIQKELENRGLEILSSGFERIPQITKKLSEAEMADIEKLIEKLEEDDDVMNVYHTMEEA